MKQQLIRNPNSDKKTTENIEHILQDIERRIEDLKLQFNLFFSGELRVPPEKDREDLERRIRNISSGNQRSPRVTILVQNVSARFSLFNNMWMKRLKELETGISTIPKKKSAILDEPERPRKPKQTETKQVDVSLNREDSFDQFFDNYSRLLSGTKTQLDKEQVINSIKSKMITSNLIDAKINLSVEEGKLKIKIKSSQ